MPIAPASSDQRHVVGNQTSPSVAMDSFGNFTVAWQGPYSPSNTTPNGIFDRVVAVDLSSYSSNATNGAGTYGTGPYFELRHPALPGH